VRSYVIGLLAFAGFWMAGSAPAEVLELEGTVKAVDSSARSITIERKTPKGTKTLELEVTKKEVEKTMQILSKDKAEADAEKIIVAKDEAEATQ